MNKHLIFSLLSTCLLISPLTARDHEDREQQDRNSNEFDLYERNEDQQDFDPYNFPKERNFEKKEPTPTSYSYYNYSNQQANRDTTNYDGAPHSNRDKDYRQNSNDKNIDYDVEFYEDGGYNADFDPYFPDVQYKYDEVLEQNKSHPYYDNMRNNPNNNPSTDNQNNNPTPNYNYQNNPNYQKTPN